MQNVISEYKMENDKIKKEYNIEKEKEKNEFQNKILEKKIE
jgi:hypothetical protein